MAPAIPDRWKDYKPVGQKVEGTRFIAFKVPLRENISNTVDSDIRLDGNILLKSIPNLGLIIDLTNTKRYYDPNFFRKMGVEYEKLMIPGRETPAKSLVDKFFSLVKKFIDKNPDNDKLIGVHCTHGVNRTGFFICNYMISHLTIEPNEAINRFATARGHQIERNNYIAALHKLMANDGSETSTERSKISNWRDRERRDKDVPAKLNDWRNRDDSAKFNNWRDREDVAARSSYLRNRGEAHSRDRFERRRKSNDRYHSRNKSRSPEIQRTNRSESRRVSNDRHHSRNKHRSLQTHKRGSYDSRRISKDNHHSRTRSRSPLARRRDKFDSRRRSPPDANRNTRQPPQYCQTTRDNKYHHTINNSISENFNNSYQHLPAARSLRTDYYTNNRSIIGRRGISLQRYRYNRNTNNS